MNEPILKNIEGLALLLAHAARVADEATSTENINQAVGTVIELGSHLKAGQALYDAILTLHRMPR